MALRTVGSTLLAKANPGGALRSKEEKLVERPDIPDAGAVGSVNRQMVEEPLQRQVPEGSVKVVSATPTVEGTTVATPGMNPAQPMAGQGMGTGMFPGESGATPSRGAANQPLFAGGVSPEAGPSASLRSNVQPGRTGSTVSGGALPGAQVATAYKSEEAPSVNVQGERSISEDRTPLSVGLFGQIGNKAFAEGTPGESKTRTLGQGIAQTVGSGLGPIFQATPVGRAIMSYANSPQVTSSGGGSIQKAVQNVGAALRSYNPVQTFSSNVNKAASVLRSLFRR